MRIAVLSDIHGNLTALDAVIADLDAVAPDIVVFGGDITGLPRPAEVIDRIRDLGWPGVMGNADEALWNLDAAPLPALVIEAVRPQLAMVRERLDDGQVAWLQSLPKEWKGHGVGVVHAVPGNLWTVVPHDAPDDVVEAAFSSLGTAVAVYGHIHHGYVRQLPNLIVANTGSVGQPYDGDWRASYLVIEDGERRHRRVAYDLERELAILQASGAPITEAAIEARRRGMPPRE